MSAPATGQEQVHRFRFVGRDFDPATGEAKLSWAFDDGEPLFERIRFPCQPWPSDPSRQAALDRALDILHLLCGVSYYKTCVPQRMNLGDLHVDGKLASFLQKLYVRGLGEFAWQNGVNLEERVNFVANRDRPPQQISLDLPERALLAMGGGKDSLVSLELLREAGLEIQPACVGSSELIAETARTSGLPLLAIERTLSPRLAQMNEAGALNGHVPVTAINSAILLCASILYGYRWIVFSNERSAEEETLLDDDGRAVNHQYSKSLEFEDAFRDQIAATVSPGIEYFSLLRPLHELAVAERFSRLERYHPVFSSCNRNFHLAGPRIAGRWCGACPKCRFTTLAMAPFVSPSGLQSWMGADLLDDPAQEEGFRALCRLGADKPFECVGSVDESRAAMLHLGSDPAWQSRYVVQKLLPELEALGVPGIDKLLAERGEHRIPARVLQHVAF